MLTRFAFLGLILTMLPAFGSGERLFAPSADLWPRWQAHDAGSSSRVDHSAWDRFLGEYLTQGADGVARVDYAAAKAGRPALQGYLDDLAATQVSRLTRAEQMAYWLNLYNALTVAVVIDHHPVASIQDIAISPGLLSSGPWDKDLITVESQDLSLNDIEHRILRPIWRDPRIHYGVNCASIGCPNLAAKAFTGAGLDAQLDAAARAYVNHPRGVSINGGEITVSKIYDWFLEDFGGSEQGVIQHLLRYAKPGLAADIRRIGDLEDTAYDWSLNGAR